ncbi:MAG: hypothetical protein DRI79_08555 [Chloroflexi bacterium]|nr:MAG: hypothetical protein DRI79_08555 [Chloroflexota bacterium]
MLVRIVHIGAAILVTLAAFALALHARRIMPTPPSPPPDELTHLEFSPYWVGMLVQVAAVPLALIYLFSNTHLFRRAVVGPITPREGLKLFAGLVAIQALTCIYELWLTGLMGEPPAFGTLVVVITGGLLGGWRAGLGLGLMVALCRGTQGVILDLGPAIGEAFQTRGLGGVLFGLPWQGALLWNYCLNLWVSSALWVGVVAGLCADLLGKRRFAPPVAPLLGAGVEAGAGCLGAVAGAPPGLFILIPNVVVSGSAMLVVALIVRNAQAEAARHRARAAELARAHAEVRALRAQINPHFLFNALNTIRYFVRTDPETARRLLLDLSEVFQRALRSGEFVPLGDEISYVKAYLALEKARLNHRLRVEWSIQTDTLLDHPVPTLILQPIVENAVIHGISRQPEGGMVRITIERTEDDLVLRVEDDGPGIASARLAEILDPARGTNAAIGLRNVDGRLRALYGDEYRLVVESEIGRGTRVEIKVPFQLSNRLKD